MQFQTPQGPLTTQITKLVVAGWTGRDQAAVDHHIKELAEIGVAPPSQVPLFYRASSNLLTQQETIEVLGPDTSGEVEPLLLHAEGKLWLGLGSDHTDRALEAVSVAASKQICAKPVAPRLWAFSEVAPHLDRIALRCEIEEDGAWVRYQEGALAAIRPLASLLKQVDLDEGAAMLCGTLAAMGGVRPAKAYRMVLTDPVAEREIALSYRVQTLPIIS